MKLQELLSLVVGTLQDLEIPFMLTGSLAGSYHGSPRATQDVDLVIDAEVSRSSGQNWVIPTDSCAMWPRLLRSRVPESTTTTLIAGFGSFLWRTSGLELASGPRLKRGTVKGLRNVGLRLTSSG